MAPSSENRSTRLVSRAARLPGGTDLVGFLAIAGVVGGLAILTAAIRFQLVDWRVESRDLQRQVRRAEAEVLDLTSDINFLERAGSLKESAAPGLGLQPLDTHQVAKLTVDAATIRRYEAAFEAEQIVEIGSRFSQEMAPLAAMISEKLPETKVLSPSAAVESPSLGDLATAPTPQERSSVVATRSSE